VDLGISSIPKRVESTGPRSDPSRESQQYQNGKADGKDEDDECSQKHLELSTGNHLSDDLDKGDELE
jgi:hypothetical protein